MYQRAAVILGLALAFALVGLAIEYIVLMASGVVSWTQTQTIRLQIFDMSIPAKQVINLGSFTGFMMLLTTGFGGTYSIHPDFNSVKIVQDNIQGRIDPVDIYLQLPFTIVGLAALIGAIVGGIVAATTFAEPDHENKDTRSTLVERSLSVGMAGFAAGLVITLFGAISTSKGMLDFRGQSILTTYSSVSGRAFFLPLAVVAFGGLVGLLLAKNGKKPSLSHLHFGFRTFVECSLLFYAVFTVLTIGYFVISAIMSKNYSSIPLIVVSGPLVTLLMIALGSLGSFSFLDTGTYSVFTPVVQTFYDASMNVMKQVASRYGISGDTVEDYIALILGEKSSSFRTHALADPAWIPLVKLALVLITFASLTVTAYFLARRMALDPEEQNWKHSWVFPLLSAVTWVFISLGFTSFGITVPLESAAAVGRINEQFSQLLDFLGKLNGQISPAMIFLGALWAFAIEALARLVFLKMVQKKAQPAPTGQAPQGTPGQAPAASQAPTAPQTAPTAPVAQPAAAQQPAPAAPQFAAQPARPAAPQAPQFAQAPQQAPQFAQPQYGQYPGQPVAPQQYANPQYPAQPTAGQQYVGQQNAAGQYPTQPGAYPQPAAYQYPQNPQDYQRNNNNQQ